MADRDQQGREKRAGAMPDPSQDPFSLAYTKVQGKEHQGKEDRTHTGAVLPSQDTKYGQRGHRDQGEKGRQEDLTQEDLASMPYREKSRWNGVMALALVALGITLIGMGVYIAFFYKNPNRIDPAPGKMLKAESSQEAPVPVEDVLLKLEDLDGEHFLRVENKSAEYAIKEVTLTYEVPTNQLDKSSQGDNPGTKDASQAAKSELQTQVGPQYRLLQIPCPIAPQGSSGLLWIANPDVLQNIAFLQYSVRQGEKQYLITYNSAYGTYTLADQSKEKHLGGPPLVSMDELKLVIQVKDDGRVVMVKNDSQAEISGLQVTYEGPNRVLGYFNIFSDRIAGGETKTYDDIALPDGEVQVVSIVYIVNNQTVVTYDAVNDQYEFSTMKDVPTA